MTAIDSLRASADAAALVARIQADTTLACARYAECAAVVLDRHPPVNAGDALRELARLLRQGVAMAGEG